MEVPFYPASVSAATALHPSPVVGGEAGPQRRLHLL